MTESLAMSPFGWEVEVLLETTLDRAERQMPPGWAILEEVEGGVLLRGQYDPLNWIALRLLEFDCPLTVRKPRELVDALRVLARRASALAERGSGAMESGRYNARS